MEKEIPIPETYFRILVGLCDTYERLFLEVVKCHLGVEDFRAARKILEEAELKCQRD